MSENRKCVCSKNYHVKVLKFQIDFSMIDPTVAHPRKQIENNKSHSY